MHTYHEHHHMEIEIRELQTITKEEQGGGGEKKMEMIPITISNHVTEIIINFISPIHIFLVATLLPVLAFLYFSLVSAKNVYLLDFSLRLPPPQYRIPSSTFLEHATLDGRFTSDGLKFQSKVLSRSGIGNHSYMPEALLHIPPDMSFTPSRNELEWVLFPTISALLKNNRINPKSIDIVVSNCSLFCPTPSISAMVSRRFGLRSNVRSYSLSGMGCSAGLLAVNLVKDLFRVHKECLALVVSMEAVGPNGYSGKKKSMLLPNCLFRAGGAALLLSNRKKDRCRTKYVLEHLVRTHLGQDDKAYRCVYHEPDDEGIVGVSLSRDLLTVAGNALKANLSTLGPRVLPYSEQLKYLISLLRPKTTAPYIPDFKRSFDHFCIHAGGRAVIDAIEERLRLTKHDVEASRMTLYRFGNTSSTSVWYELGYLEAKRRVRRGERVWQIGFGSGFKCNSAVWRCVAEVDVSGQNAWGEEIDSFPVDVPEVMDH